MPAHRVTLDAETYEKLVELWKADGGAMYPSETATRLIDEAHAKRRKA